MDPYLNRHVFILRVGFIIRNVVDSSVLVQLSSLLEGLVAHIATKRFRSCVGPEVVQHVALLCEFFSAMFERTDKYRI
jgi:hypothetical protein